MTKGVTSARIGVAGVFSISGPLIPADAAAYLAREREVPLPPLLMISAERDLDYVRAYLPEVERQFRAAGQEVEWAQVPPVFTRPKVRREVATRFLKPFAIA